METTFNFSNPNMEYIYSLHPKSEIILHITRIDTVSAYLYFTNNVNTKINIPSDFIVYNGETLYNIRREKTWTIYN